MANSFLIAVSDAALEAAAKKGELARNRPWKTDRFVSRDRALQPLSEGGALFLVTVAMFGFTKLLAVLEQPTFQKGVWVSAKRNVLPARDISAEYRKLSWASVKGKTVELKHLNKLLRSPQPLTEDDEVLLRGGMPGVNLGNLRVESRLRPSSVRDLSATQKKQLRVAGRGHDGKDLPAEARLAKRPPRDQPDPEESFAGDLEILEIADEKKKILYDVFVCGPDSGVVFRKGTTRAVAELIQEGVACKDITLRERLRRVLTKRRTSRRR